MIHPIFLEIKSSHGRYDLTKPFVRDGWLYATNVRILVRRPIDGIEAEIPEDWRDPRRKLPNPDGIFTGVSPFQATIANLPDAPEKTPCNQCGGTGEVDFIECDCCGARSNLTRNGKAVTVDCEGCDGKGSKYNDEALKVCAEPKMHLMGRYVAILRRHGVTTVKVFNSKQPVAFEGDGFSGLLMPMVAATAEENLQRQASGSPPPIQMHPNLS